MMSRRSGLGVEGVKNGVGAENSMWKGLNEWRRGEWAAIHWGVWRTGYKKGEGEGRRGLVCFWSSDEREMGGGERGGEYQGKPGEPNALSARKKSLYL